MHVLDKMMDMYRHDNATSYSDNEIRKVVCGNLSDEEVLLEERRCETMLLTLANRDNLEMEIDRHENPDDYAKRDNLVMIYGLYHSRLMDEIEERRIGWASLDTE